MSSILKTDAAALANLEEKIQALLPPRYQHCYGEVLPTSMGSAGLKYRSDGKVAWDLIWTSFCDLALAGGPPHRGKWLELSNYDTGDESGIVHELSWAIQLTTFLAAEQSVMPGWIEITCDSPEMASWLLRAIVAENVPAASDHSKLYLPAQSGFRIEKEVKNVVVALSKTLHYWSGHMNEAQQRAGFHQYPVGMPSLNNVTTFHEASQPLCERLHEATQWPVSHNLYPGWIGIQCPDETVAAWLLRAIVIENVLARRDEILFIPAVTSIDETHMVEAVFYTALRLWKVDQSREKLIQS